jgi:hypothetical protein
MATGFLDESLDVAQGAYVQSADPAVGPKKRLWIDTTNTIPVLKKRNDTNDGWDVLGWVFNPEKRVINAAGLVTNDDFYVIVDVSGGSFTIDLMSAATRSLPLKFKVKNGGTGNIATLDPNGAQTIDGNPTAELAEGDYFEILPISNTEWETI